MRSATRLPPELVDFAERLAREDLSAADIHRAVGLRAAKLGVPRPSYERTRQLVFAIRLEPLVPSWGEVISDVAWRVRPVSDLERKLGDAWPIDEDAGLHRKARRPGA